MAEQIVIRGGADIVKKRSPWGVLGLTLVTFGIYQLLWWYFVNKEMVKLGRSQGTTDLGTKPGRSVLAIVPGFLLIVPPSSRTTAEFSACRRPLARQAQSL